MRELTRGAAVRTNNKWRAFFKTDEVISGIIIGSWYDHKTAIVRPEKGMEFLMHIDWLEPDDGKCLMTK